MLSWTTEKNTNVLRLGECSYDASKILIVFLIVFIENNGEKEELDEVQG